MSCGAGIVHLGDPNGNSATWYYVNSMTSWEKMKLESFRGVSERNDITISESTTPDFCIRFGNAITDGKSSTIDCYVPFKEDKYIVYRCRGFGGDISNQCRGYSFLSGSILQSNSQKYKRYYGQGSPLFYERLFDGFVRNWYFGILIIIFSVPFYIVISLINKIKNKIRKK